MKCIVCGCDREIMVHGHYQCEDCGRTMDGDCWQGEQVQKSNKKKTASNVVLINEKRIDTNFEANDY